MKMSVSNLKLIFTVALMFTIATANNTTYITDTNICSHISKNLTISEVMPLKYTIELTIKPSKGVISGISNITIRVKDETSYIYLHFRGLKVDIQNTMITIDQDVLESSKNQTNERIYKTSMIQHCDQAQILVLIFNQFINPGQYILHMAFTSTFIERVGIIHYAYMWDTHVKNWLITNLYGPTATRGLFPCWDDPSIKATFDITIKHPSNYTSLTNTLVSNIMKEKDGMQLTHFHETVAISTHNLAIAVVDNITTYTMPSHLNYVWYTTEARASMQYALNMFRALSFYMHLDDVSLKIDHATLPNLPMKTIGRPGLVLYRKQDLVYEPNDFYGKRMNIMTIMSREMMRQWFVGLVSQHSDDDLLLREALSLFYSYFALSQMWNDTTIIDQFVVQHIQPALDNDVDLRMISVNSEVIVIDAIDELFHSYLYYKKGSALIRLVLYILSPKTFQNNINKYIRACYFDRDRNTNSIKNFWTIMESDQSIISKYKTVDTRNTLKGVMDTWLKQKQYPELYVYRDYNNDTALCYLSLTNLDAKWKVPVNYVAQSFLTTNYTYLFVQWLTWNDQFKYSDFYPNDFVIFNVMQLGYYRVNYNNQNWQRIYTYLNFDKYERIPIVNRAQLINDAYYFAVNGKLNSAIFLNIIKYLKRETECIVWYPMFNIFSYMSKYFELPESKFIKLHFVDILDGLLKQLGYEQRSKDNVMTMSLRMLAIKWACKLGHMECRKTATARLIDYVENRTMNIQAFGIESLWKNWVFCSGMVTLNRTYWHTILSKTDIYTELLKYLHCADDEQIILHYMDLLVTTDLGKRLNMTDIFYSILNKYTRTSTAFAYIFQNYGNIKSKFKLSDSKLFSELIMHSYSTEHLKAVQKFAEEKLLFVDPYLMCVIKNLISIRNTQLKKILSKFKNF